MNKKILQSFTTLSKFISKNAEILFVHYILRESVLLLNNSNKEWVQKLLLMAVLIQMNGLILSRLRVVSIFPQGKIGRTRFMRSVA